MNKKQLIVSWAMGIILCVIWVIVFFGLGNKLFVIEQFSIYFMGEQPKIPSPINFFVFLSSPVLIIGSLLIYTLKDRKK